MRILCVTPFYKPAYVYGGPARSVPALCEAMVNIGASVAVFTTNAYGSHEILGVPTFETVLVDGVEVVYYPRSVLIARAYPFYSPLLQKACESTIINFDLVYIAGSWTHPVHSTASCAYKNRVPYVISPRGSFMNWAMNEKKLKKHVYLELIERKWINRASSIHVTSLLEERQLEQWGFKPEVFRIPNGIRLSPV